MKILVVDDCGTTRKLLGFYLKSKGFDVISAENGLDAIEKLGTNSINLVLSDLNMPYMDGIELVRTMRADPQLTKMPVIMVTTEADADEREKAMSAGANGYMVKPVTAEAVTGRIKDLLKEIMKEGGA